MTREDIYQLLGISKKSPARLVKKAFREFAEHNHPDFFPGDKVREERHNIKNDTGFGSEAIEKGKGVIEYTVEGNEMMVSFKKDKNFGWTVAAVASVDEMLAPVRKLAGFNIMMTLVICVHGSTICLQ
jgi:hypothetical protein